MKQQITWDQLMELNYEQVIKLQELIEQKYHVIESFEHFEKLKNYEHTFDDGRTTNIHTSYIGFISKTNIGKMIEILEPYCPKIEKGRDWSLEIIIGTLPSYNFKNYQKKELIDALWEAIKEIMRVL